MRRRCRRSSLTSSPLRTGVAPGERLPGLGAGHMPELSRAADPERGKPLFARDCAACHNTDGSGIRRGTAGTDLGYLNPAAMGPGLVQ